MKSELTNPKPFLKWVGGKKRILDQIHSLLPTTIDTYYEPFLGGGAVFFSLKNKNLFRRAVLNDSNKHVILSYQIIKKNVDDLINELKKPKYAYSKECYLKIREEFNSGKLDDIPQAAHFIYLNKTCFNGLFRVNQKGEFNTPFGKYSNPLICDENNLRTVSKALKGNVKITCEDFGEVAKTAKTGDFVYFDPPYLPISKTANFTQYDSSGFSESDHWRLRGVFGKLYEKGVKVLLSNSSSHLSYQMYSAFELHEITAPRTVGGPTKTRKPVKELLIEG